MNGFKNAKFALEYNKVTTALSAAGFVYAGDIGSKYIQTNLKVVFTISMIGFALSFIYGLLVFGRASLLEKENENDLEMMTLGRWHMFFLAVSIIPVAVAVFSKVWA